MESEEVTLNPEIEFLFILNDYKNLEQKIENLIADFNQKNSYIKNRANEYNIKKREYDKIIEAFDLLRRNKIEFNNENFIEITHMLSKLEEEYKYILLIYKAINFSTSRSKELIPKTLKEAQSSMEYFTGFGNNHWTNAVISASILSKMKNHGIKDEGPLKLIEYFKTGDLEPFIKYVVARYIIDRSIRTKEYLSVIYFLDTKKFFNFLVKEIGINE